MVVVVVVEEDLMGEEGETEVVVVVVEWDLKDCDLVSRRIWIKRNGRVGGCSLASRVRG